MSDIPRQVLLFPDGAVADASIECTCSPHFGAHESYCGLDLIGYLCNHTTHGDPYLSPAQTNPTVTPWDGVEGSDLTFGRGEDDEEGA